MNRRIVREKKEEMKVEGDRRRWVKKKGTVTYMVKRRARMVTTEYVFWGPSALAHGLPITPYRVEW